MEGKLEDAVTPGPVVGADGTLSVTSNGGVLHALNPSDGSDRWTYDSGGSSGGNLSTSPLVLRDGTVLLPSQERLIACHRSGSPCGR
ncbi:MULTISPECIES: outer membrane protein assembly factor BamB family protein [unclassified Amycolatopsis]|uniref:outer membrane protein assembly factor BamB family protein n=1 Tax=unclassified Amycolatopsis TaxID=2618356 RepID=UPI002E24EC6E|nr:MULTISPECIES: PQQ-binding-like beta-propeller repeat protein [unclassified Amycolatopsis]